MKKIKILLPFASVAMLSTVAMPIVTSCGSKSQTYTNYIPSELLEIVDGTVKGLKAGADISKYNALTFPSNVKIIDEEAFADYSVDYSNIKNLVIPKNIKYIGNLAFARLTGLEVVDFSQLDTTDVYYFDCGTNLFGALNYYQYIYIKLNDNLTDVARETIIQKLIASGVNRDWFITPTEGHVTLKTTKEKESDGVSSIIDQLELSHLLVANESINVVIQRTGGTKGVNVDLDSYEIDKNNLKVNASMNVEEGYKLNDGDYVVYKIVISQKYGDKTQWIQTIDNLKLVYKGDGNIKVTSITLDYANREATLGETFALTPTITPKTASNKKIHWSSSDESIATVKDGVVTIVSTGIAQIYAVTDDGGFKATCDILIQEDTTGFDFYPSYDLTNYDPTSGEEPKIVGYLARASQMGIAFPSENISIPNTYNGLPVHGVAIEGFIGCEQIKSVNIPSNVQSIGENAFQYCENLQSVTFSPNSKLESIQYQAFAESGLESIDLSNCKSLTEISYYAFANDSSLSSITFPADGKLAKISYRAFSGCQSLTAIDLPDSVCDIDGTAFLDTQITTTLYNNVNYLKSGNNEHYVALNYNFTVDVSANVDLTFHNDCKVIAGQFNRVYKQGSKINATYEFNTITFGSNIRAIGSEAFAYLNDNSESGFMPKSEYYLSAKILTNFANIPTNVIYIGDEAFARQTAITSINLNNKLEYIGDSAFANCGITGALTIPSNVTQIGEELDLSLAMSASMRMSGDYSYSGAFAGNNISTVTFSAGSKLKILGHYTFFDNENITTIQLPSSLEQIGFGALAVGDSVNIQTQIPKSVKYMGSIFGGVNSATGIGYNTINASPNFTFEDTESTWNLYDDSNNSYDLRKDDVIDWHPAADYSQSAQYLSYDTDDRTVWLWIKNVD